MVQKGFRLPISMLFVFLTVLTGCATKDEIKQRQSQQFQTGGQQNSSSDEPNESIEIKTANGVVAITPTVVGYTPAQFEDPFESVNRAIFSFNHVVYTWALNPIAKGYTHILPDSVETGVSQFFGNLREPLNAINHLLQANAGKMASSLGRFLINSTIGLLGLFDPADAWFDIKPQKATLNDTLTAWNVDYGAFIVIPILGQSDVRNGFSTFTETTFAPITYVTESPQTQYIQGYDGFHEFTPKASSYETLYNESDDPYVFFRNMYMQSMLRDKQFQDVEKDANGEVTIETKGQANE